MIIEINLVNKRVAFEFFIQNTNQDYSHAYTGHGSALR